MNSNAKIKYLSTILFISTVTIMVFNSAAYSSSHDFPSLEPGIKPLPKTPPIKIEEPVKAEPNKAIEAVKPAVKAVDSSGDDIQVFEEVMRDSDGHAYRYELRAHNGTNYPVYFKIYLTSSSNCDSSLTVGKTLIDAGSTIRVGSVWRYDSSRSWSCNYEWESTEAKRQ